MQELENHYNSLRNISLQKFRDLVYKVNPDEDYTEKYHFLPQMVSTERQLKWTGCSGTQLAKNTYDFICLMMLQAYRNGVPNTKDIKILDYGCGWGRMLRLLPYFTKVQNIYGVDPTPKSIELCQEYNVPGNTQLIPHVPENLTFDTKFDIIYAYSVFTHMRGDVAKNAMNIYRQNIKDNGIVCITIRPRKYWEGRPSGGNIGPNRRVQLLNQHNNKGYAFISYAENKHGGPKNWGDTSYTLDYIEKNWDGWKVLTVDETDSISTQRLLFLKPV